MGASESKGSDSWGDPTDVFACCGVEHGVQIVVPQPGAVDSGSRSAGETGVGNGLMTRGHSHQQAVQKAIVLLADYEHYPTEEHLLAFGVACCILSTQERMLLAKQLGAKHNKVLEGMRYARKVFQEMDSVEENKFRKRLSQVEMVNFQGGVDEIEHFKAEMESGNFHGKARRMSHLQLARHDSASSHSSHGHSNTPTPTGAAGLPHDLKRRMSNMTSVSGTQVQGSPMGGAAGMRRRGSVEDAGSGSGSGSLAGMRGRSSEHRLGDGQGSSGHITRDHSRGASRERSHSTERRPSVTSHDSHHHHRHHHHHHSSGESRGRSHSRERRPSVTSSDSHHLSKLHSFDEDNDGNTGNSNVLSNKGVAVGFGRHYG